MRMDVPMDAGGKCRLEGRHLATLHQDPRLLIVRCIAPFLKCVLAVGHAPSGPGGAEAARSMRSFWVELSAILRRVGRGAPSSS